MQIHRTAARCDKLFRVAYADDGYKIGELHASENVRLAAQYYTDVGKVHWKH